VLSFDYYLPCSVIITNMERQNQLVLEDLSFISSTRRVLTDDKNDRKNENVILSCHYRELEAIRKKIGSSIDMKQENDNSGRASDWLFSTTDEVSKDQDEVSIVDHGFVRSFSQKSTSSVMSSFVSSNSLSRFNSNNDDSQQLNYDFGIIFESSSSYLSKTTKSTLEGFPVQQQQIEEPEKNGSTNKLKKRKSSLSSSSWIDTHLNLLVKKSETFVDVGLRSPPFSLCSSSPPLIKDASLIEVTSTATPIKRKLMDVQASSSEKIPETATFKSKRKFARNNQASNVSSTVTMLDNSWDD
jgi:hypothetical protein